MNPLYTIFLGDSEQRKELAVWFFLLCVVVLAVVVWVRLQ